MKLLDNYWVACCQFRSSVAKAGESYEKFRDARMENVRKYTTFLDTAVRGLLAEDEPEWEWTTNLVVFPEMSLSGPPYIGDYERKKIPISDWVKKGCVSIPGEETDIIGKKATECGVYVIGNGFERDDQFPGAYFNCCWIMDSNGKILSKYRRFHTISISPDDIFDDYVKKVGWDNLFPVVDTPLGKLAALACGEIRYPEIARMFAMKGAEVIAHCDNAGEPEPGLEAEKSPIGLAWGYGRRMRAIENCCYIPRANARGGCEIVDFYGRTIARTLSHIELDWVRAPLAMNLLREAKKSREHHNQLLTLRGHVFGHFYNNLNTWPSNFWTGKKIPDYPREDKREQSRKAVKRSLELGILRPESLKDSEKS